MSKRLYLIRHGKSIGNEMHIIQGSGYDLGLSETGREGVLSLVKRFHKNIDKIRCSESIRARETGELFTKNNELDIVLHNELREFGSGILQGLSHEEAANRYPYEYSIWQKRGDLDGILGAETGRELQARVLFFLLKYKDRKNYKELIISHAGFLRCLINTILFRDRTTPIDVSHDYIHIIDNPFSKIKILDYGIGAVSKTYKVKTFENEYFIKKIYGELRDKVETKKNIIEYLNRINEVCPYIYFFGADIDTDGSYIIEVMQFISGVHISLYILSTKVKNLMIFFKNIENDLYAYYLSYNNIVCLPNIKDKINNGLQYIAHLHLTDIDRILDLLNSDQYLENIVYYDIHRTNILFYKNKIKLVDMDSFIIAPKLFQLACLLNFFVFEGVSIDINGLVKKYAPAADLDTVKLLMKTRCLIGIIFFSKKIKSGKIGDNKYFLDKYLNIYNKII